MYALYYMFKLVYVCMIAYYQPISQPNMNKLMYPYSSVKLE